MVSPRSFCRSAELVRWQPLAIWFAFARGARAILQKPTGGLFVFKKERFDANYLKGWRETTQNLGRTVEQISRKHLQCLMYYHTGTCFLVLRLSEIRSKQFPTCCLSLMAALVQVGLNSCWLQHTRIWQKDALAVKTGIATVWVAGNIATRKGCGASHLVRRKVLLKTSWSTLMESLGEKGFENSSKLGFS